MQIYFIFSLPDSTVLAYVLKVLNERYQYGVNLVLLSVDEGITGYAMYLLVPAVSHVFVPVLAHAIYCLSRPTICICVCMSVCAQVLVWRQLSTAEKDSILHAIHFPGMCMYL